MPTIQKRNGEACEHAFEYWKQNTTHTEEHKRLCLDIATRLMAHIKSNAPASAFLELEQQCELHKIDNIGHGGFGLHSAIIAVLSDLGS
jgi:hypothetical protein